MMGGFQTNAAGFGASGEADAPNLEGFGGGQGPAKTDFFAFGFDGGANRPAQEANEEGDLSADEADEGAANTQIRRSLYHANAPGPSPQKSSQSSQKKQGPPFAVNSKIKRYRDNMQRLLESLLKQKEETSQHDEDSRSVDESLS